MTSGVYLDLFFKKRVPSISIEQLGGIEDVFELSFVSINKFDTHGEGRGTGLNPIEVMVRFEVKPELK